MTREKQKNRLCILNRDHHLSDEILSDFYVFLIRLKRLHSHLEKAVRIKDNDNTNYIVSLSDIVDFSLIRTLEIGAYEKFISEKISESIQSIDTVYELWKIHDSSTYNLVMEEEV